MLEYFAYKKYKKNKSEKDLKEEAAKSSQTDSSQSQRKDTTSAAHHDKHHSLLAPKHASDSGRPEERPVLPPDDEDWLQSILANDDPPPPLPPRVSAAELDAASDIDGASIEESNDAKKPDAKGKQKEEKPNRLSLFFSRPKKASEGLTPQDAVAPQEAEREKKDLGNVLDRLNFTARNNKVMSLTSDSAELMQKFTQVFKDLVNGVPTAYDDLTKLFDDRDGAISKGFEKLPGSLKKLVMQLPDKITGSLAPEILAAAAETQGMKMSADGGAGMKSSAKKMLTPQNLSQLLRKPGAVIGMLRAIVEALKTRWPAFLGMNVIWTVALSCEFPPPPPLAPARGLAQDTDISLQCSFSSSGTAISAVAKSVSSRRRSLVWWRPVTGSRSCPTTRLCRRRSPVETRSRRH